MGGIGLSVARMSISCDSISRSKGGSSVLSGTFESCGRSRFEGGNSASDGGISILTEGISEFVGGFSSVVLGLADDSAEGTMDGGTLEELLFCPEPCVSALCNMFSFAFPLRVCPALTWVISTECLERRRAKFLSRSLSLCRSRRLRSTAVRAQIMFTERAIRQNTPLPMHT